MRDLGEAGADGVQLVGKSPHNARQMTAEHAPTELRR